MATEFVPYVEPLGVNSRQPLHSCDQVGLRGLDHKVKMIAPQAIRVHLPISLAAALAQRGKELPAIFVIDENVLALVAAIHDMVNRARILNA